MDSASHPYFVDTDYPAVRRIMGPAREQLNDDALEVLLSELFPRTEPYDVENFMRSLQKFGRQAAPLAQRALPGMMQGAVQGGMVAGPWGALAGALGGGAASLLSGGAKPGAPQVPRPGTPPPAIRPPPTVPRGAAPAPGVPSPSAPAQLLALLTRPETLQALLSLLMSRSGRNTVQVGHRQVPAAAFANAVSEVAAEAAELAGTWFGEGSSEHLLDAHGHPRCDVPNPAERASLLIADLAAVAVAEATTEAIFEAEEDRVEWRSLDADLDDEDDPLDSYEAALEGRNPDEE